MDFDFLTLAAHEGIGFQTFQRLMSVYGSPQACLKAGPFKWRAQGWVDARVKPPNFSPIAVMESWLAGANHRCVTWLDPHYPQALRHLPSPPLVLFIVGNPAVLDSFQLAVVGSRAASPLAQRLTYDLVEPIAAQGWTITSGLALGVDGWAHRAALKAGGKTLAVLAGGLNHIYPTSHRDLAHTIVQQGGALVSEQWPDTPARPGLFPLRNRLVSGLSEGVLVVEAAARSGSLITAQLANEQGKSVFAVPASLANPKGAGCLDLLAEGAHLVRHSQDITQVLETQLINRLGLAGALPVAPTPAPPASCESPASISMPEAPSLTTRETQLMAVLSDLATHPDELVLALGWSAGEVADCLMDIHDKQALVWVAGGRVQRLR